MPDKKSFSQLSIIKQIDACVSCGLCLTVCPTYKNLQNESESPRGRLSIIKGLVAEEISISKSSYKYLDHCLMCGACEAVCPAKVEYTAILGQAKLWLHERGYKSFYDRFFGWLVYRNYRIFFLGKIIALYRMLGIQKVLPLNSVKLYADDVKTVKGKEYYPVASGVNAKGDVYLFRGCVASLFDRDTIKSSIAMLNIAGYNVIFPDNQTCCGSLAIHNGDVIRATKLKQNNLEVFTRDIPLIVTSTGCINSVSKFSDKVSSLYDILEFLAIHLKLDHESNLKIKGNVLSHIPCSQRLRTESLIASRKLLNAFCDNYLELDNSGSCCGSAGTYMYRNKQLADKVVSPLIRQVDTAETPNFIVTQNIGCRMQLMNHTRRRVTEVIHPVTLIYREKFNKHEKFD